MNGSTGGARRPFFRRRKTCPFSGANAPKIDYKDVKLLPALHLGPPRRRQYHRTVPCASA